MIKQPSQHPRWTAPEDMTILPEGFEDNSWGNDSFPHWLNKETNVAIWVDYPQAKSEFGDQEHSSDFTLCSMLWQHLTMTATISMQIITPVTLGSRSWS